MMRFVLVAMVVAIAPARAADLKELVSWLGGDDEAKRVEARQLLPREGIEAAAPLLKLLASEDIRVWRAARNVLSDICHGVGVLGKEDERRNVTDQLMAFVGGTMPPHAQREALRLLAIVTPEQYDVRELKKLALNSASREETIAALQGIGSKSARRVLQSLLNTGTPVERANVIDALSAITPADKPAVSRKLLKDEAPEVRVAAMRALAPLGSTDLIEPFQRAMAETNGRLRAEALDACLRLADVVTDSGVQRVYEYFLLQTEMSDGVRGAAIAGLVRAGHADTLEVALDEVLANEDRALQGPALMALDDVNSPDAFEALLAHYPEADPEMQLGMLALFGRKRDPVFHDVLLRELQSSDPAKQAAAFEGIVASGMPEAADAAVAYALGVQEAEKSHVALLVRSLAQDYRANGHADAAGKAYVAFYKLAQNDHDRAVALEGMKHFPSEEAKSILAAKP
ncbi:MAG: HEAT repeat domain-containing protein [Candidatus Hydrogenedentota bacterium]